MGNIRSFDKIRNDHVTHLQFMLYLTLIYIIHNFALSAYNVKLSFVTEYYNLTDLQYIYTNPIPTRIHQYFERSFMY